LIIEVVYTIFRFKESSYNSLGIWTHNDCDLEGSPEGTGKFPNANFGSERLLDSHYNKHVIQQKEFGDITKEEYLKGAQNLVNSGPGGNILSKTRSNGDEIFYNKSTNEFAVVTKDIRYKIGVEIFYFKIVYNGVWSFDYIYFPNFITITDVTC
jgi:hypothetical protein